MTFDEWVKLGYDLGFCGPPCCATHDLVPVTAAEDEEMESFGDCCVHVVRLYEDVATKKAVEAFHGPSVWRATNLGWDK